VIPACADADLKPINSSDGTDARPSFAGDFDGSWFLTRLAGTAKALELYFTGRPVDAEEALSLGIVNRVVPGDRLHNTIMECARSLAGRQ
jgi:enoyl-CoA hydratase/carnithine racemase